jgi:hypothetical protein
MGEMVTSDQGLFEVLVCRPGGHEAIRELMLPIVTAVFERAQADGHLRPDLVGTDFPMLLRMFAGIAEATRDVRPDVWRRYLELVLDGLRADRSGVTPFTVRAIGTDEIDRVNKIARGVRR